MVYDEDSDLDELEKDGTLQEAIILVVGGSSRDADGVLVDNGKARVAEALAEGRGASHIRKTEGGVRVFSKVSFEDDPRGDPAVIDSTPLVVESHWDFVQNARAWVSLNSLKRLSGKLIFVICVVTSSGANDPVHKEPDFSTNEFTWLHLLAYIFQGHQHAMMMLVKVEGTDCSDRTKAGIRDALQRGGFARSNISLESSEVETLRTTVHSALGYSVFHGTSRNNWNTMVPFCLNTVRSTAKVVDAYGPWGPDRVILFGPNLSGKSTLAQMLTLGRLDPGAVGSGYLVTSSIARGSRSGEGRGWYVVNTPDLLEMVEDLETVWGSETHNFEGLGIRGAFFGGAEGTLDRIRNEFARRLKDVESNSGARFGGAEGTLDRMVKEFARRLRVDTGGAAKSTLDELIREFGRQAEGIHTHVIYVWMKERPHVHHWMLWRIFLQSFQRCQLNSSLSVVISAADQTWVENNFSALQLAFEGCQNIFSADFPSDTVDDDGKECIEEMQEEFRLRRLNSLKDLEDRLAVLSTRPAWSGSEKVSEGKSSPRKVNNVLSKAAMNSLKSSNSLYGGVGRQNIGNSSRRSSRWRPSNRYI